MGMSYQRDIFEILQSVIGSEYIYIYKKKMPEKNMHHLKSVAMMTFT